MKQIWLDGIMGVIVGDALGLPVQFQSRRELAKNPVTDMRGFGTFHMPAGTWSDDGSLTLATLDSLKQCGEIDCDDIMERFVGWLTSGDYTPFGEAFDEGVTCVRAIEKYRKTHDADTCGVTGEYANGNGALMRILPICLWVRDWELEAAIGSIHRVAALTHNHLRSNMACGIYYFLVKGILEQEGTLQERLQRGMDRAVEYYQKNDVQQLAYYQRMFDLEAFKKTSGQEIKSSGYVVDSLEAVVWCLLTTDNLKDCLLKAVNLGEDTDTSAAIAGGLAGLYYGYKQIPREWLEQIQKRDWITQNLLL